MVLILLFQMKYQELKRLKELMLLIYLLIKQVLLLYKVTLQAVLLKRLYNLQLLVIFGVMLLMEQQMLMVV